MRAAYVRAMDGLHRFCVAVAGICLVIITVIVPWGVFNRYALDGGATWPEPMAVLLMLWFSFMSAAVCYREGLHIGLKVVPGTLGGRTRILIGWTIEAAMAFANLFMLVWGIRLVHTTWYSALADFPIMTAWLSYLPVPLGGAITTLFVIERLWNGDLFAAADDETISHVTSE